MSARTGESGYTHITSGAREANDTSFAQAGVREALRPKLVEVQVRLRRLPPQLDGFTITQITDVHIGNTIGRRFVESMVTSVNDMRSDVIAITGDLVDGRLHTLRHAAAPLADLRARHGVYFVTGNHEYYSGVDDWIEHLSSLGIHVLRNERVSIGDGDDNGSFDLAGIDDNSARWYKGHGADLSAAVDGRDSSRELILLAHQPRQVKDAIKHRVGLQLSGHTHGGQIWPWHYLVKAQQRGRLAGLSRHGDTQLYVSRGTGYWGPPVRLHAPAEITRIALRSAL